MADSKISALTSYTPPISTDVFPIVDVTTSTTKKITVANLTSYLASLAQTLTNKILSDSTSYFGNVSDVTKKLIFSLGGATTAKTMTILSSHTNDRTLTLPDATDTLTGKATTDVFTNKTYDTAGTGNILKVNGTGISDKTGTGKVVLDTSPTIATPTLTKPVMSATNPTAQTYSPTGGGTATLDLSLSNQHFITMPAGNATIALSNETNNQTFIVTITQDSVGSRTVTWFTTIKWAGGSAPTLTTTANKRDVFGFVRTGSGTYDGFVVGQNV